jgi:tRNA A-37 threonylcarbamoyl transferase component Bud32
MNRAPGLRQAIAGGFAGRGAPARAVRGAYPTLTLSMPIKVKDTLRATVNLTFDGRVIKVYHGPKARERFDQEVKVLRFLERQGCNFVPRLLEADPERLRIVTTNCGSRVEHLDDKRLKELFAELESFGVKHDDPEIRNVTYRQKDGRFCVIDFEFATILPGFEENGAST